MHYRFHALLLALSLGMLSACSGIKTYPNDLARNLVINTQTNSGSIFSSVEAALDIYDVTADCKLDYIGTIKLDRSTIDVGIKPGHNSYLSFRFHSSGFLSSSSSHISQDTLIKPRNGYQYVANVSYKNDIYSVQIFEKSSAKSQGKELATRHAEQCRQL